MGLLCDSGMGILRFCLKKCFDLVFAQMHIEQCVFIRIKYFILKIMKKLICISAILLSGIFFQNLSAQTAYQGFNKLHYEQVLRTGECPGCMLYQARFSKLNLSDANFSGAMLVGARFRYTILKDANFRGAALRGADFTGADLSGATWVDGRACQSGSKGYCNTGQSEQQK